VLPEGLDFARIMLAKSKLITLGKPLITKEISYFLTGAVKHGTCGIPLDGWKLQTPTDTNL
jgi:hypothetical protein